MRTYQLYLKDGNVWVWIGTIEAATHADAFRAALLSLGPGDDERPIRIEQDTEGAYHKPINPGQSLRSHATDERAEMSAGGSEGRNPPQVRPNTAADRKRRVSPPPPRGISARVRVG